MTEIAWIVKLMTSYKLPDDAKEACIARIGEVEEKMSQPQQPFYWPAPNSIVTPAQPLGQYPTATISTGPLNPSLVNTPNPTGLPQSASTLAALARQAQGETALIGRLPITPPGEVIKGLEGVAISTGNGLRGKRKW